MNEKELCKLAVPGNFWWRFEERLHSSINEFGEAEGEAWSAIYPMKFFVTKRTTCGVWVSQCSISATQEDFVPGQKLYWFAHARFINDGWEKRFANPTKELALQSLIARKKRQKSIYLARIKVTENVITLAKRELTKLTTTIPPQNLFLQSHPND